MALDVRPSVMPLWESLGFTFQSAVGGLPNRYTGSLIVHGHHIKVTIEKHGDGSTATWIYNPPLGLKGHRCVNEKPGKGPGRGWYVVHYENPVPASVGDAINALYLVMEQVLGR
jgi:hypothetical protein